MMQEERRVMSEQKKSRKGCANQRNSGTAGESWGMGNTAVVNANRVVRRDKEMFMPLLQQAATSYNLHSLTTSGPLGLLRHGRFLLFGLHSGTAKTLTLNLGPLLDELAGDDLEDFLDACS